VAQVREAVRVAEAILEHGSEGREHRLR
jgi:hypothetical protein